MKAMKKLFAMLLATLMMVGMLATTATAATVGTVTIDHDHAGHIYEAYQIFAGDLHGGVLSKVEWGDGINMAVDGNSNGDSDFIEEIQNIERLGGTPLAGKEEADDVAEVLAKWSHDDAALKKFAEIVAKYSDNRHVITNDTNFVDGKYVIEFSEVGYFLIRDYAPSTALGEATATDYIMQVVGNATVEIKAVNPTFSKTVHNNLNGTYSEAMAVQNGDTVYFKLESKMPSMLPDYKQYSLVFSETLPTGLSNLTVEAVYLQPATGAAKPLTKDTHYTDNSTSTSLEIKTMDLIRTVGDLKNNDTFVVKYSAIVDASAAGFPFGKGPSGNGLVNTATLQFSNDMNQMDGPDVSRATLTDRAYIYSFGLDITKVNSTDDAPLEGAKFVLSRDFSGEGIKYAVLANNIVTDWTTDENAATKLTSNASGKIIVKGLGAVSYNLEEVEPPQGFNQMDAAIIIAINPAIDAYGALNALNGTADTATVTGDVADGLLDISVKNNPGTVLPTTGGIGTTIFYIVGGVLVLGAGAAFVMKRRNEEA